MKSEMVERVAKAIDIAALESKNSPMLAEARLGKYPPSNFGLIIARAAIAAMREPTEAMIVAADDVFVSGADLHDFVAYQCAGPVWQAMIAEALK